MPWTVNGEPLDDSVIRQEARLLHAQLVEAAPEDDALTIQMRAWEWARENVIERVLLRQAALQNPAPLPDGLLEMAIQDFASQPGRTLLGDGPHFERELEIQLRVQRLTSALTSSVAPISNKEVAEYYRKHRDSFVAPEMVHAAHIVKNVDERAD